jgi:hypothetical protein
MADDQNRIPFGGKDPKDLAREFADTGNSLQSMADQIKGLAQQTEGISTSVNTNLRGAARAYKDISSELNKSVESERDYEKILKRNKEIKQKMLDLEIDREIILRRVATATDDELAAYRKVLRSIYDGIEGMKEMSGVTGEVADKAKEIASAGERFSKLAEAIGNLPIIGKALAGPLKEAAAAAEKAAEDGATPFEARMKGALVAASGLSAKLGPAALLGILLKTSKETKDLSTNLGISLDSAVGLQKSFATYASQSRDARITSTALADAQNKLQQELKLGVIFSGETLENFVKLTEYMGVSAQAAAKLTMLSESLSMNSSEFQNNLAESVVQSSAALGINLPLSEAFETIGKASTNTLINLRRNPEELGKAVAEAKRLGIEFNQLEQVSSSMLNFESSIANELEAELLTGRQLNLEQARLAALRGDTLQLTKEIASQVGTIADFENMNVIARESLAQAFGMNKDQLAEILLRQEALTANEQASRDLSYEQLQLAKERAGATGDLGAALLEVQQEADLAKNFENSAKKLQDAFKQIALQVTPMVTKLADLVAKFAASPLGKLSAAAVLAGVTASTIAMAVKGFRGISPAMPLYTRDAMAGGGMVQAKSGAFYPANSPQGKMIRTKGGTVPLKNAKAGRFRGTAGNMALGAGIGIAGSMIGGAIKDSAETEAMAAVGGGLAMAGQGAMIGSIFGPVGMGVGAAIGGITGAITGYMEKSQKMQEEAQKKRDEEFQQAMRDLSMQEAKVFMDSNAVGTSLVLGHNYQVQ